MTTTQKTIISLIIVLIGAGIFYYFYTTEKAGVEITQRPNSLPGSISYGSIPEGLPNDPILAAKENEAKLAQQKQEDEKKDQEYKASLRAEYYEDGFPRTVDLNMFRINKPLYEEGVYSYAIYSRETEGSMPIVRLTSSTKEYVGLTISWQDILSPDGRRFAYIRDDIIIRSDHVQSRELCIAKIDPKSITCLHPKEGETFTVFVGNYDELATRGTWTSTTTFRYPVFKAEPRLIGVDYESEPIRFESVSL